ENPPGLQRPRGKGKGTEARKNRLSLGTTWGDTPSDSSQGLDSFCSETRKTAGIPSATQGMWRGVRAVTQHHRGGGSLCHAATDLAFPQPFGRTTPAAVCGSGFPIPSKDAEFPYRNG